MKVNKQILGDIATFAFVTPILYVSVACMVFGYRNPTANEMALIRDTHAVLTFQKLAKYQTPHMESE